MSTSPTHSFLYLADQQRYAMQAAITDLLAAAGISSFKPVDVARHLKLDKTLAWKLTRLIESTDTAEAFRHMPGPAGVEIVLRAAEQCSVDPHLLQRLRDVHRSMQQFVEHSAGDRRTFEAMLAGESPDPRAELEERRSYFRSGCAIWGVRAQLQFLSLILKPSHIRTGYLDITSVSGLIHLERLQPDLPWIVRRLQARTDSGSSVFPVQRIPLVEARAAQNLPPLFDEFCSSPLPKLQQSQRPGGWTYDELVPGPVGKPGAATVILGERYLGTVPMHRSPDNTIGEYALTLRTPTQAVIFDLLLHRDLSHFGSATRSLYGLLEGIPLTGTPAASNDPRGRLIPQAPALDLGSPAFIHTHRLPNYTTIIQRALELSQFGPLQHFRGYRAELDFPAFPADLRLSLPIHDNPQ